MANGDYRTADEIKDSGDELTVAAHYSGGAVPHARSDVDNNDGEDWKLTADEDDPRWYTSDEPSSPEQQFEYDQQAAVDNYRSALADNLNSAQEDAARAFDVKDTELLQAHTMEVLNHAYAEALQMGASAEQIDATFIANPGYFLREAALTAAQQIHDSAITGRMLPKV